MSEWVLGVHFVGAESDDGVDKKGGGDVVNLDQLRVVETVAASRRLTVVVVVVMVKKTSCYNIKHLKHLGTRAIT